MTDNVKTFAKGELVFTSFLLAVSLVVLWDAYSLQETGVDTIVGPKAFAYGVGGLMLLLSVLQLLSVARGNLGEPEAIEGGELSAQVNWKALFTVMAAIAYFILVLQLLGFLIAAIPMFVAIAYALGERRWVKMGAIAVVVSVVTFFGFTKGLGLELPAGFEFLNTEGKQTQSPDEETW